MADLSLDDIIGKNQGQNVKQRLFNRNARPVQQRIQQKPFKLGFVTKLNNPGGNALKRPFSALGPNAKPGIAIKPRGAQIPNSGGRPGMPGKGQIDARDMITIKNRIKMGDARTKIIQKRMNQGNAGGAQSRQPPGGPAGPQGFGPGSQQPFAPQQQAGFQPGPGSLGPPGPQRFQQPNEQGAPFQQPRPLLEQQGPRMNQLRPPMLNPQQGPLFSQQPGSPMGQQQRPPFAPRQRPQFNQQPQRPFSQQQRPPFNQQSPPFNQQQRPFNPQRPPFNQKQGPPFNPQQGPFSQQQGPHFNPQQGPPFNPQGPPFNQQQGPLLNQQQGLLFNQQGLPFNQQQGPAFDQQHPQFNQPPQEFNEPLPDFDQQPAEFIPEQFEQLPPQFEEQVPPFGPDEPLQFGLDPQFDQDAPFNPQGPQEPPFGQQGSPGQQFNQPAPLFNEHPSQMNQPPNFMEVLPGPKPGQPPNFNQPPHGQGFNSVPNLNKPPPDFMQLPAEMNQPPPGFGQLPTGFNEAAPGFQPVDDTGMMTANHTLVEDTGTSLKITCTVPEVSFDGENLTVTRRVPSGNQFQEAQKAFGILGAGGHFNASRPAAPQPPKRKFQPTPIKAPSPPRNTVKTGGPTLSGNKTRVPFAGPVPVSTWSQTQPQNTKPALGKPGPSTSAVEPITNIRISTARPETTPASATITRTVNNPPLQPSRIKPPPQTMTVSSAPERPSALSRIQLPNQNTSSVFSRIQQQQPASTSRPAMSRAQQQVLGASVLSRLSSPNYPVAKRPTPSPAAPAPHQSTRVLQASPITRVAVKRPAMSLSERFASGGLGNPIPVITDNTSVNKRRRSTEPEPEKVDFRNEFPRTGQFQSPEEPGVPLLSPLQGYRIMVSNLHSTVTQDDVIELFGLLGPLKRAKLLTNGQADVAFIHKEHAQLALKTYHNRELDGQPMFLKLMTPLNAKLMQPSGSEDSSQASLPPALRAKKPPANNLAPVDIPLIHKALFKTSTDPTAPSKAVRFTVKL